MNNMKKLLEGVKLSELVIMSDVDGTLISGNGVIPARNKEAIRRFTEKGGRFGIATGRSPFWIRAFVEELVVNCPCVCFNGGNLYDFEKEESIMDLLLPEHTKAYVEILDQLPVRVGLVIMTWLHYHNISAEDDLVKGFLEMRQRDYVGYEDWHSVKENWYKVLLSIEAKDHSACMEFLAAKEFPDVRFTSTSYRLVEMIPELSSKAYALEKLTELTDIRRERIVAIGDFYNDLEMLEYAGIAATVEGAPQELLDAADFVTGPCENGAVADLIEYLEAVCG